VQFLATTNANLPWDFYPLVKQIKIHPGENTQIAYYAKNNIRVNVIAPALVETPMAQRAANDEIILSFIKTKQPLDGGRIGHPSDLDGMAVYFMSDQSKFTTGQIIAVDGGWIIVDG
jgi:NAD(P)-dependent dehydrogenase (short-subunit alcohol dehydrogenase family)